MEEHHANGSMQVFYHHMYEYQKGLRHLILHTTKNNYQGKMAEILEKNNINYIIVPTGDKKINVFFGNNACIQVLKEIGKKDLAKYTDEEDFILGIMLGYDRLKQCERYLERKKNRSNVDELIG
ncbi:DUF2023 family protein [Methanolobus sp. ZRKC2]|uniref:DUF2023 family protein n=1 Tax=Methanolobus sp. ZRKC2 TaxID=3125783 RepID=UPI003253C515